MKPAGTGKGLVPVDAAGQGFGDRAVRPVIYDLAGPLVGAGFQKIDADTARAEHNAACIYAKAAQFAQAGLCQVVFGQNSHKGGIQAVVRQADGYIGFTAAESRFQDRGLHQAVMAGRFQAQHDLSEGNSLYHK